MEDNSIQEIIVKAITEEVLNDQEQALLKDWLSKEGNRELYENLKKKDYLFNKLADRHNIDLVAEKSELDKKITARGKVIDIRASWYRYAAAGVILIIVSSVFLLINRYSTKDNKPEVSTAVVENDVAPGKAKALLTLSDGRKIVLDTAAIGKLAQQGSADVMNQDGQLVYNQQGQPSSEMLYNTLSTDKGETYSTVLADGSKIWLNSGSSIRFPVAFAANERKVEITGEAYFEIAKDAGRPFSVSANNVTVQVLGTHFNINSYADEATIKATLLEGSIKVSVNNTEKIIKPGQQAQVDDGGAINIVNDANVDEVMAWKNGRFYFDRADISTVMRQLVRWYNIEVMYEGEKPKQLFAGEMERNLNLSQVLRALEHTGIRFKIEGRKLIVMP